jgi:hypothetical protein
MSAETIPATIHWLLITVEATEARDILMAANCVQSPVTRS